MNRDYTSANLADQVRLVDREGMDLGYMTLGEAQRLAAEQVGELSVIAREDQVAIVRIVIIKRPPTS